MRLRRRTAAWLCVLVLVLSLGGAGFLLLRPSHVRTAVLEALKGALAEGYEAELDAARFDFGEGVFRAEGLRIRRTSDGEVLVRVPRLEVSSRPWQLVAHLRATDVRLFDPEVLVEIDEQRRIPLFAAIRTTGGPAGARPRVRVEGGLLRVRAPEFLAPGEEVRFAIRDLDWQESRSGDPSSLAGTLEETGSPLRGGAGALGRVVVRGEAPPGRRGLQVLVEKFAWDGATEERLSAGVRETLGAFAFRGTFGEGHDAPGLELSLSRDPAAAGPGLDLSLRARPRDAALEFRDLPVPLQVVRGDVTLGSGGLRVKDLDVRASGGRLHVDGSLSRLSGEAPGELRFWARGIRLDRELRAHMPAAVRRVWEAYDFAGRVDLTEAPAGSPESDCVIKRETEGGPVQVDVTAQVSDGEMAFRGYEGPDGTRQGFVYPVRGATGRIDVRYPVEGDAVEIELQGLRGTHGAVAVEARGTVREWPRRRARVSVTVDASEVPLDGDVRDASPAMEALFRTWSPRGVAAGVRVQVDQDPDRDSGAHEQVTISLDGRAGFTWKGLPVPLESVSGTIVAGKPLVQGVRVPVTSLTGLKGTAAGGRFSADGAVEGEGDARLRLNVLAEGIRLDGPLEEAIRAVPVEAALAVWDRAHPRGTADVRAEISGTASRRREVFRVELRGASASGWGDLAFPLEGATGIVLVQPEEVELRDVRARNSGREVSLAGFVRDPGGAAVLDLGATVPAAPLDGSLRGILGGAAKNVEAYLATVRPADGLAGDATLRIEGPAASLSVSAVLDGVRGGAGILGLRELEARGGRVAYRGDVVTLEGFEGTLAGKEVRVPAARFDLAREEGTMELEARGLRFPEDLAGFLPEEDVETLARALPGRFLHVGGVRAALSGGWRRVVLEGTASLSTRREGDTAGIGLEGVFRTGGFTVLLPAAGGGPASLSGRVEVSRGRLRAGVAVEEIQGSLEVAGSIGPGSEGVTAALSGATARVEGRELRDASADLTFREGSFLLKDLGGVLAGGSLGASIQVGGEKGGFEGRVTLGNAGARALFAPDDAENPVRGGVSGSVNFRSPTGSTDDLRGSGEVVISQGKLLKVPVFDSIYGFFGLEAPEFESAKLVWRMAGEKVTFDEIDVDSSVLGLHKAVGGSHAWLDGTLDIRLRPEFKTLSAIPLIGDILNLIGKGLEPVYERIHTIYVGGTIQKPEVSNQFLGTLFASGVGERPALPPPHVTPIPRLPPLDF